MSEDRITIKIDGMEIEAEKGSTILQTALKNDIYIPNLCNHSDIKPYGACRMCLVENAEGRLITACENLVEDGMEIISENEKISQVRKIVAKLLIANHERDCLKCSQDGNCALQDVSAYMGVEEEDLKNLRSSIPEIPRDLSNPFFIRDLNKCILCGICVRVCSELVGASAIDFSFRGYQTKIATFNDKDIIESPCVSCGECVEACPVGALIPKQNSRPSREVKTICPYCGVGCGIYLGVRGEKIVSVRGDRENPVNQGYLCVKGRFGMDFINHPARLTSPLVKKDGKFKKVSWNEALDLVAEKFSQISGDAFALMASSKCTNEDNYLFQKFTRKVMGTNNIDHCARLCHAPSVAGLYQSIGTGAMTNSIGEIEDSDCILAIGTNTTSTHPVIGMKVIQAVKNGSKLIVINPQEIELSKHAEIFIQPKPGTDVALIMGMIRFMVDENLVDHDFINQRCNGFESFQKSLNEFDMDTVEKITGVEKEDIIHAARLYATSKNSSILYAMGITQHSHGTDNVMALSNLALITGNIGKSGAGINPLRGQNNIQGSCDMGGLPDVYPGYQRVDDPQVAHKFEHEWGTVLSPVPGLRIPEMINNIENGKIKSMYIIGENPVLSEPDASHVAEALEKLEFLVVQDIFLSETAQLADVVLPASSFAEKDGTFTNTERRVQRIRKALNSPGDAKPDWLIIKEIAEKMNAEGFNFKNPSEIFHEIRKLTPSYAGISYSRLDREGIQWPCVNNDHDGTVFLHQDRFPTSNGKGNLIPLEYKPSAELPDDEFPFILTTGRKLCHYHTGTMSRKVDGLNTLCGHEFVEMSYDDASALGLKQGDVVTVKSRRGKVKAELKLTTKIQQGLVSMTFHFSETPTNMLTNPATDPNSLTPEFKVCAVRIEK
ncbi:MAG: formate dehydrogenase subunit alpha [Methanobacteriaceae archaeon]|nr:formate dehydrogenase subunit alpha [Methanobacteriaceae archaeon]